MALIRIKENGNVKIPPGILSRLGLRSGGRVKAQIKGESLVLTPKAEQDSCEYTPAQRRFIDSRLAEAEADVQANRTYGPFRNAEEAIASLKAQLRRRGVAKKSR